MARGADWVYQTGHFRLKKALLMSEGQSFIQPVESNIHITVTAGSSKLPTLRPPRIINMAEAPGVGGWGADALTLRLLPPTVGSVMPRPSHRFHHRSSVQPAFLKCSASGQSQDGLDDTRAPATSWGNATASGCP